MAIPGLPKSLERAIFRKFVEILQRDETLGQNGVVRTWRVWSGKPDDDDPPAQGAMPWVRLTPRPERVFLKEVDNYVAGLSVLVEVAVAGTNADDLFDLWGAIRTALINTRQFQASDVGQAMRDVGCHFFEISEGATFPQRAPNQDPAVTDLRASAVVTLSTFVPA